jgi:methionyl-tRNA formyltransferase
MLMKMMSLTSHMRRGCVRHTCSAALVLQGGIQPQQRNNSRYRASWVPLNDRSCRMDRSGCHVRWMSQFTCHSSAIDDGVGKKKVVFLGTPDVAAMVLKDLIDYSRKDNSCDWVVSAVVTQPGRPKGRRNKGVPQPSPVQLAAEEYGVPEDMIFCPIKASEGDFINSMKDIGPDLCITAAYGNYLPTSFLSIPKNGTLNIHPSLLPLYRGAAPVQRSLEDGLKRTGVSVLFTVKEMDAGPIVVQTEYDVPDTMQAPELLSVLFKLGTTSLVECLPKVWDGTIVPQEQDHSKATHAAKLERAQGALDFQHLSAQACHNKVRAFAGWPGTYHSFTFVKDGVKEMIEVKVLETRVREDCLTDAERDALRENMVLFNGRDAMMVMCADGSILEILRLQSPGKKPAAASAFNNGLTGKTVLHS